MTILDSLPSKTPGIVEYLLVHQPAGLSVFSCAPVPEAWGALFRQHSGSFGGRWFATIEAANAKFESWRSA